MSYDGNGSSSLGNLATKTDAGSYAYRNDKVNAVAYITNPAGATTPPSVIPTTTQEIAYTSFLKTSTVAQDGYRMELTYGADEQRIRGVYSKDGVVTEERHYLDGYERQIANGHDRYIHYINGGNGLAAMVVSENGSSRVYFVYSDHLGSILTLTDESGMLEARQNFDAWGRDRNPDDWSYNNLPARPEWLYRGYTGHEHLRQFGLVNMNGRMYDPVQGRMLSPDNYIQQPDNTQSYNRYSYCINNPLKYTDPTGDFFIAPLLVAAIVKGAIIGAAVYTVQGMVNNNWTIGGLIKSTVFGAVSGAATFGIGELFSTGGLFANFSSAEKLLTQGGLHGVKAGLMTGIAGGDIKSAFLASAVSDLSGYGLDALGDSKLLTLAGGSLVGGVTSSLSGGSFWDGVRDAAITVGLNQLMHPSTQKIAAQRDALRKRILADGKLTLDEANLWWRNGGGESLTVDANKIDLNFLDPDDWSIGQKKDINTLYRSDDGLIYGKLPITYIGNSQFSIGDNAYDFNIETDPKGGLKQWIRNKATKLGEWRAGKGTPYMIKFRGVNTVGSEILHRIGNAIDGWSDWR